MKVTIKDIARECGLSIGAVSSILNNKPCRILAEKKELVKKTAQKYNYSANHAARSLVTKKTNMLALIVPDIENIYFSTLAKAIEEYCRDRGYITIICSSNDKYENDTKLLSTVVSRGVDGVFMIVSNESYNDNSNLIEMFNDLTIPFVMIDRIYNDYDCEKVFFDNEQGAYLACKHILDNGHKKIGCVINPLSSGGKSRYKGYVKALNEYGIDVKDEYIAEGDYRYQSGYTAAAQLAKTDITATFVSNDMMALGYLNYLHSINTRVPEDFSLVGYDNSVSRIIAEIELTSVDQNAQLLGIEACQLMLSQLNTSLNKNESMKNNDGMISNDGMKSNDGTREDNIEACSISLSPGLVIRNSVKKLI